MRDLSISKRGQIPLTNDIADRVDSEEDIGDPALDMVDSEEDIVDSAGRVDSEEDIVELERPS